MVELLFQFAVEFVRALLIDELSKRARELANRWFVTRSKACYRKIILHVHCRNRDRLLNRLLTEIGRDL
jgi:hypothetical protein